VPSESKGFLSTVELLRSRIEHLDRYPFSIPAVAALVTRITLDPKATFFVGENGAGKSTLVEAIAVAAGFNPEGGSQNFSFSSRASESLLHRCIRIARTERRPTTGFFLRAESFFNVATNIEELDRIPAAAPRVIDSYGGQSLHEKSHGESFMALAMHRFGPRGLYILDEPEAALSPSNQLALLKRLRDLTRAGSQVIIATHSPVLLALPGALIYSLTDEGVKSVSYEDTEQYRLIKKFMSDRETVLRELLDDS